MKNKILILGIIIGILVVFSGHKAVVLTSGDKFCVVCHGWMDPMVDTYKNDIHSGVSRSGIKAECVDCHLPHENIASYLFQKGINGVSEVTHMILNDPKEHNWQEHRKSRESFVYDSGCLSCHSKILETKNTNESVNKMHSLYKEFANKDSKKLSCVSCHKFVGHKNLGKTLHDIKHIDVGEWEKLKDE